MIRMSREAELSLLLVTALARKEKEFISLKEWAENNDLPYRFLSKVAVKLKKKGILVSKEGRKGGYKLGKPAEKISVEEIIKAVEGPIEPLRCMSSSCECEAICYHKHLMTKLTKAVKKQLAKTTVKDLSG